MSSSSTQLPSGATAIKKRPTRARANAVVPETLEDDEPLSLPQFFFEMQSPVTTLTHYCDIHDLFGDKIATFENPDAYDKKKSLRRLMEMTSPKQKTDNLTQEQYRNIAKELGRLVAHTVNCDGPFVRLFFKITACTIASLKQLLHAAPSLGLDRTVSTHPRLQTLNLFNTGFFVESGHAFAKMFIYADAMQKKIRKTVADGRYGRLCQAAGAYLLSLPLKIDVFREGVPTGWQLHPDTNTPLTDFEIQEQNNRITADFLFLCVGILVAIQQTEKANQTVARALTFTDA